MHDQLTSIRDQTVLTEFDVTVRINGPEISFIDSGSPENSTNHTSMQESDELLLLEIEFWIVLDFQLEERQYYCIMVIVVIYSWPFKRSMILGEYSMFLKVC